MQKPKTYAEALEELGGQPWRRLERTEQWFLVDETEDREPDTGSFRIPRPSSRLWLGLAAALFTGGVCALLIVPGAPPPTLSIAAPPAQIVLVAAAPVAVAAVAPVRVAAVAPMRVAAVAPVRAAAAPVAVAAPRVLKRHFKQRKRR